MENLNQKQSSKMWKFVISVTVVFAIIDSFTTVFGIFLGVPSDQPIKVAVALILSSFITSIIYGIRIILNLEDSNIKYAWMIALVVSIGIDGWTSYEGIHRFIKPQNEDYFGWMLLIILLIGCISSPIFFSYREEIKSKLE
jgi:hypothetical protein